MSSDSRAAAELTLFLLESVGAESGVMQTETVLSFANTSQTDRKSVLDQLAAVPKPTVCTVQRRGRGLELQCKPLSPDEQMLFDTRRQNVATGEGVFGTLKADYPVQSGAEVEFRSTAGQALRVPVGIALRWAEEYAIPAITQLELSTKGLLGASRTTPVITFSTQPQISGLLELRED